MRHPPTATLVEVKPGNFLDGEFDSPPSPPEKRAAFRPKFAGQKAAHMALVTDTHTMFTAPKVLRLPHNPILVPGMDSRIGNNLNGPSLIKVPKWVENPLGQYYLYFAHHDGHFIRLAYSDKLTGPWKIHTPGSLDISDTFFTGHVASPDVHIDEEQQRILMYFHGSNTRSGAGGKQCTRLAISSDGISFASRTENLGNPYFRVFQWNEFHYAIGMPGVLYRSKDGISNFEQGSTLFTPNMRHTALEKRGTTLWIFFTDVGDTPERIKAATMDLRVDWNAWHPSGHIDVLKPEKSWEGVGEVSIPSSRGLVHGAVNQLRDPAIFKEDDKSYILYSVAGENGIAIAELIYEV